MRTGETWQWPCLEIRRMFSYVVSFHQVPQPHTLYLHSWPSPRDNPNALWLCHNIMEHLFGHQVVALVRNTVLGRRTLSSWSSEIQQQIQFSWWEWIYFFHVTLIAVIKPRRTITYNPYLCQFWYPDELTGLLILSINLPYFEIIKFKCMGLKWNYKILLWVPEVV